ncbi:PepSY domain-containing protein [Zavarzinia compransoris]|uniref:PepSY-associated TM helix domain-containing protein n=1 Tax=Zavarzinia marina TaxID=2911065 RepID=UPI001F474314|nr:PepSY-associated TM helix domain-containing protein [Zavarzinia marina]MCF4167202.1 PepSY domain-containing protein [Zavarzinia marina]
MRTKLLAVHRYVGLAIAAFLAMSGLTGSVIAFHHELDEWLNPSLFQVDTEGEPLAVDTLARRTEETIPDVVISGISLPDEAGHPYVFWAEPEKGIEEDAVPNQIFVDPVTGEVLGARHFGECCFSAENLIPFLYVFHYSLALPDRWGMWFMGLVSIFWFVDCFVGAILTMPRNRPFFTNWWPAFTMKKKAAFYRRNVDIHRAGGLWPWALLAVIAMSGVALNLQYEVFRPLVSLVTEVTPGPIEVGMPRFVEDPPPAKVGIEEAMARGAAKAEAEGFEGRVLGAYRFSMFRAYMVTYGEAEHPVGLGVATIYLDDQTGEPLLTENPGEGTVGDLFLQIQYPLHSGRIIGLPGRILISIMGVVVATLSITGIVIWGYKRKGRVASKRRKLVKQPAS